MRSWKIGATLLVASLAVRVAVVSAFGPELHPVWAYMFFPSTVCFFMLGHLICLAGRRWSALVRPSLGIAFLAASFAFIAFGYYGPFDSPRFWSATLCFVVALPALFEATKSWRWMNALGDLSYPVYLVHIVGGAALADIVLPLGSPYLSSLAWLVVVIAVAAVVHGAIEVPVAHAMQRMMAFS